MISATKTGKIFYGLDFDKYLEIQAVSKSALVEMTRSPAHYLYRRTHPITPTDRMVFGSAVDSWLTEGEPAYRNKYITRPPGLDLRTREGKAWKKEAEGLEVVPTTLNGQVCSVDGCVNAVLEHPVTAGLLEPCVKQASMVYYDRDMSDLDLKIRPDYWCDGEPCYLVDLKTSAKTDPDGFSRQAMALRYHWQAALYLDVASAVTGRQYKDFYFVVADPVEPHPVEVYRLGEAEIELGRDEYRSALRALAWCVAEGDWPSTTGGIRDLSFPTWAWR
jgi:hypothetical protein